MSKQLGKLLVLGGFALRLFMEGINLIIKLLHVSVALSGAKFISVMWILTTLVVIAGLGMTFLAEFNKYDFLLAIIFVFDLARPIIFLLATKLGANSLLIEIYRDLSNAESFSFLIIQTSLWVCLILSMKYFWNGKPKESGIATIGIYAFALQILPVIFSALSKSAFYNFILNFMPLIIVSGWTLAAFLDYRNDN